ncbi:phytoene desaturase family protein [Rhodococcus qingshengii]|uniref:phytoene desaturase family protein n=1 Tax=Rhodococcus qingshengii TaxID=334542 RepID=UPI0024BB6DF8|nr:NAD(P)/FAD-dependent oxidoreductase [Rhodococcus qingshengii]MDJ0441203.1 NAD(P)/FAD-dependent oxidoreductase [Rhodococcus qingshengii]
MSDNDADVVIIGGGHNGLVAGSYLARSGKKVVLVEASSDLGGMTTSGRFIDSAPDHIIHPCAVDVIFMRTTSIAKDLELRRHGYRTIETDAAYAYLHADGSSIVIWRDPERTASEIRRFSPADADAYLKFTKMLKALLAVGVPVMRTDLSHPEIGEIRRVLGAVVGNRRQIGEMVALVVTSAVQAVAERFSHPAVRAALIGLAAGAGPVEADGSGMAFLLLGLLHEYGVSRPIGGMQTLVNSLASSFQASGGKVFVDSPVAQVLLEGDRARGVELEDGRVIKAKSVLSTADPHTTLRDLVADGVLDRQTLARVDHIPANAAGASPFKVDMALSGLLTIPNHIHPDVDLRHPVILYGTEDDVVSSFTACTRNELPSNPFMWACIPTAVDPTQAPVGQDTLYLYPPAMPARPLRGWKDLSGDAEKLTVERAQQFIGGIDEFEIGRLTETPEQMAARTRAWKGSILHVDFSPLRTGPLRPAWGLGGYRTPIDGLFLGGAGTHPSGSVTGLPGKLSAARVRRYVDQLAP